jgi:hypothetical protein
MSVKHRGLQIRCALFARFTCILLILAGAYGIIFTARAADRDSAWPVGKTYKLAGLRVDLSAPVLVGRGEPGRPVFNFPKIVGLRNGELIAHVEVTAETWEGEQNDVLWSSDGCLTWGGAARCPIATSARVLLPSGDIILLPYRLYPRQDGIGGPYCLIPSGKHEVRFVKDGIVVTGWPREPVTSKQQHEHGQASFVFDGQTVALKDGKYLVTLNGWLDQPGLQDGTFQVWGLAFKTSVVAAESEDGLHWKIRSVIADEKWKLSGAEGPNEASLCRLKDGRLFSVFRSYGWGLIYGQSWSSDEGQTWTEPVYSTWAWSVDPRLAVVKDGTVVLSGGRPGVLMWFSADGSGKDWQTIDLIDHHNAFHPDDPITRYSPAPGAAFYADAGSSTGYTEVATLDDSHVLCMYDKSPLRVKTHMRGEMIAPAAAQANADARDTWSVWAVRATLSKNSQ